MAIYLGNKEIQDVYLGSHKVKEIYLGSELVYKEDTEYPKPPYPEGLSIYEVKTKADWDESKYPQEPFVLLVSGDVNIPVDVINGNQYIQYADVENGLVIAGSVFYNCPNLKTVYIGNTVQEIGMYSFSSCTNLEEVVIGDGVTTIRSYDFSMCSSLKSLILGKSIQEIEGFAFANCPNLKCIYFYGDSEPIVGENAFYNVLSSVMVKPAYSDEKFGSLDVTTSTVEGCSVMQ